MNQKDFQRQTPIMKEPKTCSTESGSLMPLGICFSSVSVCKSYTFGHEGWRRGHSTKHGLLEHLTSRIRPCLYQGAHLRILNV